MTIKINGRAISQGKPAYLVAELSANHSQSYDKAERLLRVAKEIGADAVKLQTYTADMITLDCDNEHFRVKGTIWEGRTFHDLYKEAYTPWEWQPKLKRAAEKLGLDLFSSPFDDTAVDFLEKMNVPAYKIASFELNHIPLLRKVAATGKPVILSTGMATEAEIKEAIDALRGAGCKELALLKCTSAYPAPPEEMNLNTIPDMRRKFGCPVGLSDHTMSVVVPAAAVALGACVIEKHLTLSRKEKGPDSSFSLEPAEFQAMVESVRIVEKALGSVDYAGGSKQAESRAFRRSLFVAKDVRKGETFTAENLRCVRPAAGMHPRRLSEMLGKRASKDIARGTPLTEQLVEGLKKRA